MGRRGPSLVGTAARTAVVVGTATAVSGRVASNQQAKATQAAQVQASQQQAAAEAATAAQLAAGQPAPDAPAPTAVGLGDDVIDQLKQLAELRQDGVLTEEEFAATKSKLLGL